VSLLTSIFHLFWTSVILYIFLVLAFSSTIAVTILTQQPTGPEGPVGAWLLLLIPCLFVAILVFALFAKGSLNFIPGGGLVQFVIAVGILITFSIAIFALLGRYNSVVQGLFIAVPFLILAGCAAIIHQSGFPNPGLVQFVAAILLGGTALTGWGLAGTGIFIYVQKDLERAAQRAQAEREQEEQREQWEVAEYGKLDDSAPLNTLLPFTWSRNNQVRQQAREQVSSFPELDDKLIELLDQDYEEAISYVADVYENPPAKLAPAWGRMLERQLKKWDILQHDQYAGKWENNLLDYFEGAQKIQLAGGSLHNELLLWHKHLLKCKGLWSLAAFVKSLLQTKSK
jgi:hypothetical protein